MYNKCNAFCVIVLSHKKCRENGPYIEEDWRRRKTEMVNFMDVIDVIDSIESRVYDSGERMTEEEAAVLEANMDDPDVMCYYALGLLMNSTVRFDTVFGFESYDDKQLEAFELLQRAMDMGSPEAFYWMAEIKCGLFGKFPMETEGAWKLYEWYYNLTHDQITREKVLDKWEEFLEGRKERFEDLKFEEQVRKINLPGIELGNHDEAYYESLSASDDDDRG